MTNQPIKLGCNRASLIKNNILNTNAKSVLEIGSGTGLVGAYIRSKHNAIEYPGIESDKDGFENQNF